MKLLLATGNKGKVHEMREALDGLGLTMLSLNDIAKIDAPEENGTTFAENAIIKARHYHTASRLASIADDSGIEVEALQGELGIHTRRWGAGVDASDAEWIEFFLQRMKKEKNKRARFLCTLALIEPDGTLRSFEGVCDGEITDALEADYLPGLPLSACFRPIGEKHVFSALSTEHKNRTSHRGRALMLAREYFGKGSAKH